MQTSCEVGSPIQTCCWRSAAVGRFFTAYAHYVVAFDALSRGERHEAREHLYLATQTGDFQNGIFWWSKAFLSRIDDPNWLPWLDDEPAVVDGGKSEN